MAISKKEIKIRILIFEDTDKVNQMSSSRKMGAFNEVSTLHGSCAAQMYEMSSFCKFLSQLTCIVMLALAQVEGMMAVVDDEKKRQIIL